jgi:hypothetical protein
MDQRTNDPNDPQGKRLPQLDKTFVEGSDLSSTYTPLSTGARLNATTTGANPYNQTISEITDINSLPSGTEQIPLGSGVITGLLGTGGMAKVYKIWNEKLEVFRAVKILIPGRGSDLKNRFDTESKITAKLHHPNIIEIYNVGEWRGLPYLEMEFIDGFSLESIISKYGRLPNPVCSAIALFVARALVYAHGQKFLLYGKTYHGVIHRDLKPPNIMISVGGEVRLMDFGIARPTEVSLHTVEGNIVGTMQYLSPEQIDASEIDARSDLYSFGAILYEILTGTKTFPQETITNLMKKKIINEYRKFSDFDFDVAPELSRIAQRCLQSDRENRYASAADLLEHLEEAHRSITKEEPEAVLASYLKDPAQYVSPEHAKTISFPKVKFTKKTAIIAAASGAGALAIGVLIAILLHNPPQEIQPPKPKPKPDSVVVVPPNPKPDSPHIVVVHDTVKPPTPIVKPPVVDHHGGGHNGGGTVYPPPPHPDTPKIIKPVEPAIPTFADLAAKYGAKDAATVARSALRAGRPAEALIALESSAGNSMDPKLKTLLFFEADLDANKLTEASRIADGPNLQDAQFDFLCGRYNQLRGKNESSIELFDASLTKSSIVRKGGEIRNDALYYTAVARSEINRKDPSGDNRSQATNAWNVVKRQYSNSPDSPRYRKACDELASLK